MDTNGTPERLFDKLNAARCVAEEFHRKLDDLPLLAPERPKLEREFTTAQGQAIALYLAYATSRQSL